MTAPPCLLLLFHPQAPSLRLTRLLPPAPSLMTGARASAVPPQPASVRRLPLPARPASALETALVPSQPPGQQQTRQLGPVALRAGRVHSCLPARPRRPHQQSLAPLVALREEDPSQARLLRRVLLPAPRVVAGAPVCQSARLPPLPVRLLGPLVMMEAAAPSLLHRQLQRHQA